jgi:peptide deformylase
MMDNLPDYVVVNDLIIPELKRVYLRVPGQEVKLPLSSEDRMILSILEAKHDEAKGNVTGLAAPQIGYNKRMVVFAVQDDPQIKKIRNDFKETMPRTVWINPTYRPLTDELTDDYDLCLSVKDIVGSVKRFAKIAYTAYLPDGTFVEGEATGFLARIIQHEIDHINGILFIDKVEKGSIMTTQEYINLNSQL